MGFLKKGVLVLVCVLIFIVILIGNGFLALGLSLSYNNIQNELVPVVKEVAIDNLNIEGELNADFDLITDNYCDSYDEFTFNKEGYAFAIPCSVIQNGSEAFVSYGVDAFVKEIYYQEYDCDFWKCFEKSEYPTFLVSEKARDYWMGKFYLTLLIFIVLIVSVFFLVEEKTNSMVLVGSFLIVGSLPFLAIDKIMSFFLEKIYLELVAAFFSSSHSVFLISLSVGIILLGAGIAVKFWDFGNFISEKFGKKKNANSRTISGKRSKRNKTAC